MQPPQAPRDDLPEPSKDHPVVFPKSVECNVGRMVKIDGKSLGPITLAHYPGIRDVSDAYCFDKSILFCAAKEGLYWVGVSTTVDGLASQPVWVQIKVGIPPPPVPPIPPVPPVPPVPPPSPAPIPLPGLRVMMIFDKAKATTRPVGQTALLYSAQMHKFMDGLSVMGPDNKQHEWRIWPSDLKPADTQYEAKHWKDVYARPRSSSEWLIISNGVSGYEGPLPASMDEAKALIQKFAK